MAFTRSAWPKRSPSRNSAQGGQQRWSSATSSSRQEVQCARNASSTRARAVSTELRMPWMSKKSSKPFTWTMCRGAAALVVCTSML
eukprot:8136008-Pyramimonas_sp.AAC.1